MKKRPGLAHLKKKKEQLSKVNQAKCHRKTSVVTLCYTGLDHWLYVNTHSFNQLDLMYFSKAQLRFANICPDQIPYKTLYNSSWKKYLETHSNGAYNLELLRLLVLEQNGYVLQPKLQNFLPWTMMTSTTKAGFWAWWAPHVSWVWCQLDLSGVK